MTCTIDCPRPKGLQAHCGVCHLTFSRVSGFDLHRRRGGCPDPQAIGMVESGGIWRRPISDRDRVRLASRGLVAQKATPASD